MKVINDSHTKKYQAVIFDLDGVLIDSKECMRRCWHEVQEKIDTRISFDSYFANIGKPFKNILQEIGVPRAKWKDAEDTYFSAQINHSNIIKSYEGIDDLISYLAQKVVLGLVTSKNSKATAYILNQHKWVFSQVITPENCSRGKPNPDPLLYFSSLEQIEPDKCVYVGDMVVDYEAASAAGFSFIRAGWGYQIFKANTANSSTELIKMLGI